MYRQKYDVIYIAFISVKQIAAVKILYVFCLFIQFYSSFKCLVNNENTW